MWDVLDPFTFWESQQSAWVFTQRDIGQQEDRHEIFVGYWYIYMFPFQSISSHFYNGSHDHMNRNNMERCSRENDPATASPAANFIGWSSGVLASAVWRFASSCAWFSWSWWVSRSVPEKPLGTIQCGALQLHQLVSKDQIDNVLFMYVYIYIYMVNSLDISIVYRLVSGEYNKIFTDISSIDSGDIPNQLSQVCGATP